ncbi:hypothetical protein [Falsochrobactrum shanghaiense]|uniref:hypothetical protein n=1 Tax=Falsochrobactrum shanghaiense TaxID=2201899 RepID=UPI001304BC00|nr:hypothetical protein [Falsochrobactrum shanghaiense]
MNRSLSRQGDKQSTEQRPIRETSTRPVADRQPKAEENHQPRNTGIGEPRFLDHHPGDVGDGGEKGGRAEDGDAHGEQNLSVDEGAQFGLQGDGLAASMRGTSSATLRTVN